MKSQAERSLQSILKDQPLAYCSSLTELLPQGSFANKSEEIKRNISDFIQNCFTNNKLVEEMIDRGVKNDQFSSQYEKSLALFSVEILSGQFGDSYKLFIKDDDLKKSVRKPKNSKNQSQIEEEIQQEPSSSQQDNFNEKYSNLVNLLQYIHRPLPQLSQICMNYFVKIFTNIINNKAEDVYAYFEHQSNKKSKIIEENQQQNVTSSLLQQNQKTQLQYLIDHAYNFGGVSQMLGKMVAQEGSVSKYIGIKQKIVQSILKMLKSDQIIRGNPNNFQYLLDFVSYVLSRTKYKSQDQTQQIARVSQRYVDQDIIWFFKQKIIKAALDSNSLLGNGFMSSSGTLNKSQSSKCPRKDQLRPQNEEQFQSLQNVFENSVAYMRIIIQRINSEQEFEQDLSQSMKTPQPTMDFQVDQVLFGQNSLYQLLTLPVPFLYKNLNKMWYYELLLKLTRNSRYKKQNHEKQMGLLPSFLVPILVHLLKTFRKQHRHNGLVNFYVEELMCESILPRIQKFDNKQAMMVLSALNPSKEILNKFDDTKAYSQKILLIMRRKCQWFGDHVNKLGLDLNKIQSNYITKLGGNTSVIQNRKNVVKQFTFLQEIGAKPEQKKSNTISKSQRCEDDDSSGDQDKFLGSFNPRRQFYYPQNTSSNSAEQITQNKNSDVQRNLFSNEQQIKQQINQANSEILQEQCEVLHIPKQKIQLLIDSAGQEQPEQNQVIRQDMLPQQSPKQ